MKLFFTRYSLYINNYPNMDITRSSFSGIPPFIKKNKNKRGQFEHQRFCAFYRSKKG